MEELLDRDWSFVLRNCRRRVPPRERLLKRFRLVIEHFRFLADAKTGEPLLRPIALAACALLEKHIQAGCLSDPDGVAMYYATGKNTVGLPTYRCVRGTNSTEVTRKIEKSTSKYIRIDVVVATVYV